LQYQKKENLSASSNSSELREGASEEGVKKKCAKKFKIQRKAGELRN
jgi:hypothetical protein